MHPARLLYALLLALAMQAQSGKFPAGTEISVQTDEAIDTKGPADNRVYRGIVVVDASDRRGRVLIPKGSTAELIFRDSLPDTIALDLESLTVSGQRYVSQTISMAEGVKQSEKSGVVVGTAPGNYAGKSLLATVVSAMPAAATVSNSAPTPITSGVNVKLPVQTVIRFRLERAMIPGGADPGYTKEGHHYHWYDRDDRDR